MKQLNSNLMYIFNKAVKQAKCYCSKQAVNNFESIEKCGEFAIKIVYKDGDDLHYICYDLQKGWYC